MAVQHAKAAVAVGGVLLLVAFTCAVSIGVFGSSSSEPLARVGGSRAAGVPALRRMDEVGAAFPGVGFRCGSCGFCSEPVSPWQFVFNFTMISDAQATAGDKVVDYTSPEGGHYEYFASPCNDLQVTTVPGFNGNCSGDMGVCYCTSDFHKCESIGNRAGENWLVPEANTAFGNVIIQNYTAGLCETTGGPWNTYIFYSCDPGEDGYEAGTVNEIHEDPWGLCVPDTNQSTFCNRCLQWYTNGACPSFASARESYIENPFSIPGELIAATAGAQKTSTSIHITVQAVNQFGDPFTVSPGGHFIFDWDPMAGATLSSNVVDNNDGTYTMTLYAHTTMINPPWEGVIVGDFNVAVVIVHPTGERGTVGSFDVRVMQYGTAGHGSSSGSQSGSHGSGSGGGGGGGDAVGVVLAILAVLAAAGLAVLGVRWYQKRNPSAPGFSRL